MSELNGSKIFKMPKTRGVDCVSFNVPQPELIEVNVSLPPDTLHPNQLYMVVDFTDKKLPAIFFCNWASKEKMWRMGQHGIPPNGNQSWCLAQIGFVPKIG
jgi:hypothetical protein